MFNSLRLPALATFASTADLDWLRRRRDFDWGGNWQWSFEADPPVRLPPIGLLPAEAPIDHATNEIVTRGVSVYGGTDTEPAMLRVVCDQLTITADETTGGVSLYTPNLTIDGWLEPPKAPSEHLGTGLYASLIEAVGDRWTVRESLEVTQATDGHRSVALGFGVRERVRPIEVDGFSGHIDETIGLRLINGDIGVWGRFENSARVTNDQTSCELKAGFQGEYLKQVQTINYRTDLSFELGDQNSRFGAYLALTGENRANGIAHGRWLFGSKFDLIYRPDSGPDSGPGGRVLVHGSNLDSGVKVELYTGPLIVSGAVKLNHDFNHSSYSLGISVIG